jgi:hypothetical protein
MQNPQRVDRCQLCVISLTRGKELHPRSTVGFLSFFFFWKIQQIKLTMLRAAMVQRVTRCKFMSTNDFDFHVTVGWRLAC